ncbi:MAG: apolipoprotein N-acyltransferase [Planctomycetota bacterium]
MSDHREDEATPPPRPRVLAWAIAGAVLLWLAQPPVGLWPLAWFAPVFWLRLTTMAAPFRKWDYVRFWVGSTLYWALAVHWVCYPHPLTPLGVPPLAMYLAVYPTAMLAITRAGHLRLGLPLWLVAPVAWTAMELLQARLFTGFLMGAVSHTQVSQAWLRSLATYGGAYAVTFAVVLVAATLTLLWTEPDRSKRRVRVAGFVVAVLLVSTAGSLARWSVAIESANEPPARVALIQGDTRATWSPDPDRNRNIMDRQTALSLEAFKRAQAAGDPLDLIVWPESMFRAPLYTFDGSPTVPSDADSSRAAASRNTADWFRSLTGSVRASALVGIDRFDWGTDEQGETTVGLYNSVALADRSGTITAVYDKMHLVPFGEYIPFASNLPALAALTPVNSGLRAGERAVAMNVPLDGDRTLRLSPSVCYESVVPRVIRRHVVELTDNGDRPDALVNVTFDAWFWGSSELDMHLACGVFRAVEHGLPLLIAANGGLSAVIDATGEVLQVSPRMEEHVLLANVPPKSAAATFYTRYGDLFAGTCLTGCGLIVVGCYARRSSRTDSADPTASQP